MNEEQHSSDIPAGLSDSTDSQAAPHSGPVAAHEPLAGLEPMARFEPAGDQNPAQPPSTKQQAASPASAGKAGAPRRQGNPGQDPARVADYFTACPRCSFFLAGYRLIFQDFDLAAAGATDDWLDLSWNLAVRNLLMKSYGYEMAEPFEALQGVCPLCRRAFIVETADEQDQSYRFSMQINPRG